MTRRGWLTIGILGVGVATAFFPAGDGYSQSTPTATEPSLLKRLATKWNVNEAEAAKRLQQLGQELQAEMSSGRVADLPGVGRLQVVKVMPHRESQQGRPVLVTRNTVHLVPAEGLQSAANSPGARPVETILPADYFYQDFPYGGAAIDRNPPLTTGSARDLRPSNNPSNKIGGSRRP